MDEKTLQLIDEVKEMIARNYPSLDIDSFNFEIDLMDYLNLEMDFTLSGAANLSPEEFYEYLKSIYASLFQQHENSMSL